MISEVGHLREAVIEKGADKIALWMCEAIHRKLNPIHLSQGSRFDKTAFSIKELWHVFMGDTDPMTEGFKFGGNMGTEEYFGCDKLKEDVSSTAFAIVTGNTIQRVFILAYEQVKRIGPDLATDVPSKLKIDTFTGFKTLELPKHEIAEGMPYPQFGVADKYVTAIEPPKHGGIIEIAKETITFDQTGQIVTIAQGLGERLATQQEYLDVGAVFDAFFDSGVAGVFRPSGTLAELFPTNNDQNNYLSGATTRLTLTNGITAIQAARNKFLELLDDSTDQFPILTDPDMIVAGDNDADVLRVLMTSQGNPTSANLSLNPLGHSRHGYTVKTSKMVNHHRTNSSRVPTNGWLMGSFKKQFGKKIIWPLETWMKRGDDTSAGFDRDVVFQFKVRSKQEIFARDTRYVVFVVGA